MEYKKSKWEIEYDKFNENKEELKSKMAAIRREQATLKEGPEYASKKKELDDLKKQQVKYDKIEKNKPKIENILKLKKDLVEKTSKLLEEKSEIDNNEKMVSDFEKTLKSLDKQRDDIVKGIQQIDNQLKNPNLKEEERNKLQAERNEKVNAYKENNTKYSETAKEKDEVGKKLETVDKDKINGELLKNEKLIGKCDLIGANLVKGKSMEEISTKLENFEFKPNKDFARKIQAMRELYSKGKHIENPEPEVTEPENPEPEVTEPENPEPEVTEPENPKPVKVNKFSQWFAKVKENIKEKGFLKGIFGSFKKEEIEEAEVTEPEVTEPEVTEPEVTEPEKLDDDFEYAMKKLEGKDQDKVLKEIAEKGTSGFRESMKVSKQEILDNMRKQSANAYAEKYGGKYTTQDGANLENDDKDR